MSEHPMLQRFYVMTKTQHDSMLEKRRQTPIRFMDTSITEGMALHRMRFLGTWISRLCVWDSEAFKLVAILDQQIRLEFDPIAPEIYHFHIQGQVQGMFGNVVRVLHPYPDPGSRYHDHIDPS